MPDLFRVGLIVRSHGVHGAVKLLPLTDDTTRFHALRDAYLEQAGAYTPVVAQDVSVRPDAVYLKLPQCESREQADALRGAYICVDREHAAKLPEGSYFVADLIGCRVVDTEGKDWGVLSDVLETGANDVYVIDGREQLMLPALKKLLVRVDISAKSILVDAAVLREVGLFAD